MTACPEPADGPGTLPLDHRERGWRYCDGNGTSRPAGDGLCYCKAMKRSKMATAVATIGTMEPKSSNDWKLGVPGGRALPSKLSAALFKPRPFANPYESYRFFFSKFLSVLRCPHISAGSQKINNLCFEVDKYSNMEYKEGVHVGNHQSDWFR